MATQAWLTPDTAPTGTRVICLYVPEGEEWETIVRGALAPLMLPENFEKYGDFTPEETAQMFREITSATFAWEDCGA